MKKQTEKVIKFITKRIGPYWTIGSNIGKVSDIVKLTETSYGTVVTAINTLCNNGILDRCNGIHVIGYPKNTCNKFSKSIGQLNAAIRLIDKTSIFDSRTSSVLTRNGDIIRCISTINGEETLVNIKDVNKALDCAIAGIENKFDMNIVSSILRNRENLKIELSNE